MDQNKTSSLHSDPEDMIEEVNDDVNDEPSGSEDKRKVRVRTAISEEQQNILKEYYARNPKPGREEFRAIAQISSLDSRVVQVWYQNNRSRERKLQIQLSSTVANMDDQPLDLSVKRGTSSTPSSNSPRYEIAPLSSEEVIN